MPKVKQLLAKAKKKAAKAVTKVKEKLSPLVKFDWRKEIRKAGFKVSRLGVITKQVLNQPKEKIHTEKSLIRRQAITGIPAYKTKKYTKTQALNNVAREAGYRNIKQYFRERKTDSHRKFERQALKNKKDTSLSSEFERAYANYANAGYAEQSEEEYELLYESGLIDEEDYRTYTED